MERPACTNCGESVSPDWIVCPVCTQPTKKSSSGLLCLQCNGGITADQLICSHCHGPIIRRYCSRCERLIPDHAELCPFCGAGREQKRSLRRILRLAASLTAAAGILILVVLYLPGKSSNDMPVKQQKSSMLPVLSEKAPAPAFTRPESDLTLASPPIGLDDLAPSSNIVEAIPARVEEKPVNASELMQRGARLKAGRKLNDLGNLYIRKRRFKEAAMVLKEAVKAFPPETRDVTYGESLYHLGYSLRMSGKPAEAIPILKLALNFPLYSSKVEKELKTASAEMKKSR
jgi:RNA polymerase subunit RPABC4/transcription elongation factor Spt4/tetratricopeptide (TPR) repeat protein